MFHHEFNEQLSLPAFEEFNSTDLADLVAIDDDGIANSQAGDVVIDRVVRIGPGKNVEPLEVVHPDDQQNKPRNDEDANLEFWSEFVHCDGRFKRLRASDMGIWLSPWKATTNASSKPSALSAVLAR